MAGEQGTVEACPGCGFVWSDVRDDEVAGRVIDGARLLAGRLAGGVLGLDRRPAPAVWSPLEYACHVRDVLLHLRDRLVITLVEDDATFKPMYRDERVDLGLYAGDDPDEVGMEVVVAASLFARTFDRIDRSQLHRPCQFGHPVPAPRTLRYIGQQMVHEIEHHLGDLDRGLAGAERAPA